jgi:NitT/TauT family transport system ATP-binding protein
MAARPSTHPHAAAVVNPAWSPSRRALAITNVSKVYGSAEAPVLALDQFSLTVEGGEFVCLVGASGCGKSTLLHMVAGLESPSRGTISAPGPPALMFQEAALLPWLSLWSNVALALRLQGVEKAERRERTRDLLRLVHLEGMGSRRPHELSGGMRQRAALARALAQDADVLLMDEPFAALDAITRDILHDELERIWQQTGVTILFVTHNVREAVRLADRVLVLSSRPGRVVAEFPVTLPRPRRLDDPDVAVLTAGIVERLRQEVRRHG